MLTTSYPRWRGDLAGCFVEKLAAYLVRDDKCRVCVFAPAAPRVSSNEANGPLEVHRLRYFWPSRLQRLAYGAGMPVNLRQGWVAWLNIPTLLLAFLSVLLFRARRADVIHAHWGVLAFLAIITRPAHGRPVVVTVHGSDLHRETATVGVSSLTRFAVRHADAVITPSPQFQRRCIQIRKRDDRCYFIPHGVDAPSGKVLTARRAQRAAEQDGMRLVTVGRLIAERRHALLLEAFHRVLQAFPCTTLTIVGDGPEKQNLQSVVENLRLTRSVSLVGEVPTSRVADYLLDADIYVSPTAVETFGMAVAEAAACALPIITTRVGFPAELVVDGETGYVIQLDSANELDSVDELAAAILRMLENTTETRRMGEASRQRMDELKLTHGGAAMRTLEVYHNVMTGGSFGEADEADRSPPASPAGSTCIAPTDTTPLA